MSSARRSGLVVVAVLLFVSGWATNHFAAIIPVLRDREGLSTTVLAGAFGIYALGLLPGLLGGGALSDRTGRRPLVLVGATVAAAGNLLMLCWHPVAGIFLGRLVVGVGVGLAMSAGTAWAADLGGRTGTTVAGTVLTAGFASGPLATGLVAEAVSGSAQLVAPFALTIVLSLAGVVLGVVAAPPASGATDDGGAAQPDGERLGVGRALARSVPMALWVFASVTVPIVVLAGRVSAGTGGPWLAGVASALALGTGVVTQVLARRAGWGPRAGIVGALLAAGGFVLAAVVDHTAGVALFVLTSVVLGSAYGLCLRAGLLDVETLTPAEHRGAVIGIYYVCTYLGFGLPVLIEALRAPVGTLTPYVVLSAAALLAAGLRTAQLRRPAQ